MDLIEHYEWCILCAEDLTRETVWTIFGSFGVVQETTLRAALEKAHKAQIDWFSTQEIAGG
jgi:hypothetical protein